MGVKCFLLSSTNRYEVSLRRFAFQKVDEAHFCTTSVVIGIEEHAEQPACGAPFDAREKYRDRVEWPTRCAVCARVFLNEGFQNGGEWVNPDPWQVNFDCLYTRSDGGPETTLRAAPPGAMWFADWLHGYEKWCGPDKRSLHVMLPDLSPWCVDQEASNCTRKGDFSHKCWVRHGEPPNVTVDKGKKGESCDAGAGSIQTPKWHGFLRNGELVE